MYSVCAQVNDVGIVKVPLELSGEKGEGGQEGRFSVRIDAVSKFKFDGDIRLCSDSRVCVGEASYRLRPAYQIDIPVLTRQSYWDSYTSGDHSFTTSTRDSKGSLSSMRRTSTSWMMQAKRAPFSW